MRQGLAPVATIVPPNEHVIVPFFWNLLTWHLFDSKKWFLTAPGIAYMMKELELVFGTKNMLSHMLINLFVYY